MKHWHHARGQIKNSSEAYFILRFWLVIQSRRCEWISRSLLFSIWRLTASPPYPPSLASRSNTPVPPDSLSRLRAKLAASPPSRHQPLSLSHPLFPLSPIFVFTSHPHFSLVSLGFFPLPSSRSSVRHLFPPPLPSAASSLIRSHIASSLLSPDLLFFFSQFRMLSLSLPPPCLGPYK